MRFPSNGTLNFLHDINIIANIVSRNYHTETIGQSVDNRKSANAYLTKPASRRLDMLIQTTVPLRFTGTGEFIECR